MLGKNKGITLVALVVTIIVLLILAGVSINLVLGENGLINNAKEAKRKTAEATVNEQKDINEVSNYVENNTKELPQTETTKPYYPSEEFKMLNGTSLDNGLVIEDASGNQYVWVEVPMTIEVYPTAGVNITDFNTENYTKIENDLHSYTRTYRNDTSNKDEYYADSNNPPEWFENEEEYNSQKYRMLKSVYQSGGFWVGRYEAGITEIRTKNTKPTDIPQTKEGLCPYMYVTRTQAEMLAEKISYGEKTGSLMFGVQWDLILKYVEVKKSKVDPDIVTKLNSDSTEIGNFYSSEFL